MSLRAPQWARGGGAPARLKPRATTRLVYQCKVTLKGAQPTVWRRFLIGSDVSLHRLHRALQIVMGWEDYHLYEFTIRGARYGIPDAEYEMFGMEMRDAKRARLHDVAASGGRFRYRYDFGDGWEHDVAVEAVRGREPKAHYPVCLHGQHACPPEDCGGIGGYAEFLEAISNPAHERHEELLTWIGGSFDPEQFDLKVVNAELRRLR